MTRGLQQRRGNSNEHDGFNGQPGEITVNTDRWTVVVQDGSTLGGYELVGVAATQRITNKDIVATNLTVSGVSTLSNTTVGGATTELIVDGDVSINNNLYVSNELIVPDVVATNINTGDLQSSTAYVNILDVGGTEVPNPGSNFFVNGTSVVTDSISIGSSAPSPEDTRFFAANFSDEEVFTTPGTYTWTAPVGVTSVSVVCVGGGGGGVRVPYSSSRVSGSGGGGLAWKNNIPVTPGQSYTVVVGSGGTVLTTPNNFVKHIAGTGGTSYFISESIVAAYGGGGGISFSTSFDAPAIGGTYFGDGGGDGGAGGRALTSTYAAGSGGAGGYTGVGGTGRDGGSLLSGFNGTGGGGGGGSASYTGSSKAGGSGGGVGLYGQGSNGSGGFYDGSLLGNPGKGGSGGSTGDRTTTTSGNAGVYGGGGRSSTIHAAYEGGGGAVRIIWSTGGTVKEFPSTNVATGTDYFVYNRNGNVGIGTTNPQSRMEVIGGDVKVGIDTSNGIILTSANGTQYRIFVNNNGTLSTTSL